MKAAVVTSFAAPPRCRDHPEPVATGEHDIVVEVIAAGLHPRVRSQADGSHYASTDELPLVPGIDGVGRGPDGVLRYFVVGDTTLGSMAERTVIDTRRSVVLDGTVDPVTVAAAMNPAMASWVALRRRIDFVADHDVLVLGATGSAGRLAVQVARQLGARRIVAAGRDARRLSVAGDLGAAVTVDLADATRVAAAAADVDVVLDFVWGEASAAAMIAIVTARTDRGRPLTWVEVGSAAGPTAEIPSAALRGARLQIVGSGQGSVPTGDIVAELPALAEAITTGRLTTDARTVPLAEVERAWGDDGPERIVIVNPAALG